MIFNFTVYIARSFKQLMLEKHFHALTNQTLNQLFR